MFGALFGWRKASKCKKLIKKVQCRLKLLRNKRTAIVKLLREDIALLLRNGHEHVAFSRLGQLYMDENLKEVYELLDSFCEFVLMKLSYIRKHRDCPADLNEAVSSLVFASARFGDLPELQVIRKLFGERYGQKFATSAVELLPGNLVNLQMIEKLSMNSVLDYAKNRLLDDIIRESLFQPGLLAIEYNRSPQHPQVAEQNDYKSVVPRSMESSVANETEQNSSDFEFHSTNTKKEPIQSPQAYHENDSIALQSSSPGPMPESLKIKDAVDKLEIFDSSSDYPEQSLVYLDDIEEFKSPARKADEQDQRMFIFKPPQIQKSPKVQPQSPSSHSKMQSAKKRQRRRSLSKDYKQLSINDCGYEVYYSGSPLQRKHPKKGHETASLARESELDGPVQSFRFWIREEKPENLIRATSLPEQREKESKESDLGRSASLPWESPAELNRRALLSPRHVHPKLPDYDELEVKFMALKKLHQESKLMMKVR